MFETYFFRISRKRLFTSSIKYAITEPFVRIRQYFSFKYVVVILGAVDGSE
jgi:hypothetical protein